MKKKEQQEPQIDQKKLDNWYALQLSRRYSTQNPGELRAAAMLYGVTTDVGIIDKDGNQLVTIRDKKLRIIAQKPVSYFLLTPLSNEQDTAL